MKHAWELLARFIVLGHDFFKISSLPAWVSDHQIWV